MKKKNVANNTMINIWIDEFIFSSNISWKMFYFHNCIESILGKNQMTVFVLVYLLILFIFFINFFYVFILFFHYFVSLFQYHTLLVPVIFSKSLKFPPFKLFSFQLKLSTVSVLTYCCEKIVWSFYYDCIQFKDLMEILGNFKNP